MSDHDATLTAPVYHGDPDERLQHHFDDKEQQFDAGNLGIWLFLVTEILFFSGLFCAYSIYRSNHPEVFVYASKFLDTNLGAINTAVLIVSSLTAAWAVRAAQLGNKKQLITHIIITILCACTFMVVKYFEYDHKLHIGISPGGTFTMTPEGAAAETNEAIVRAADGAPVVPGIGEVRNQHLFWTIYYAMTGLHGIHVLGGIIVWLWLLKRAMAGHFGKKFFGPIHFTALYWHIVDLIWIYLFPLFYLIH